jgi:glucose-1-phosphate thymidylyltransferase
MEKNHSAINPPLNILFLAAGYGTRLKKIGEQTPKGLFKNSKNTSITDMIVGCLKKIPQIQDWALVSNNRFFENYQDYFSQNYPQLKIRILNDGTNNPEERLGSLGDLVFVLDELNWWDKSVLVLASDRTPEGIIPHLVKLYNQHPDCFITCVAQQSKEIIANRSGCAELDSNQQIISFEEKPAQPKSNYQAIPFYIFPQKSLKLLKKYHQSNKNMDAPGNIIPWLLQHNFPVYAHITNKTSIDIGNLEDLKKFRSTKSQ